MSNFFPAIINEVPSKKDAVAVVNEALENKNHTDIEKYVWFKWIEFLAKEGIKTIQPKAIESFLTVTEGSTHENILGVDVTITKERITKTFEKYSFSDTVSDLEMKIEKKENELKLLRDKLTMQKQLEINHDIAKKEIWEEDGGESVGIRVALRK